MSRDFTPVSFQSVEQLPVGPRTDAGARHYHQIPAGQLLLIKAKAFLYQTLDTVALDCVSGIPDRYSGTQSRVRQ